MSTILVLLLLTWIVLHLILHPKPTQNPIMISHRGAAGLAPENTLASVREATRRGAQFIEVDVQRSTDGILVLMHDRTVSRTTNGKGWIGQLTWDEIRELDAGSHFSPRFAGESIPSLESTLELIKEQNVTLVLEAKNPSLYPGIEKQIAETLQRFDATEQVIVVSLDRDWLERFNELAPDIPKGYLCLWTYNSLQIPTVGIVGVYWPSVILDPTLVRRIHHQGRQVLAWTVNDVRLIGLLIGLGVDSITTDHPEVWPEAAGTNSPG